MAASRPGLWTREFLLVWCGTFLTIFFALRALS